MISLPLSGQRFTQFVSNFRRHSVEHKKKIIVFGLRSYSTFAPLFTNYSFVPANNHVETWKKPHHTDNSEQQTENLFSHTLTAYTHILRPFPLPNIIIMYFPRSETRRDPINFEPCNNNVCVCEWVWVLGVLCSGRQSHTQSAQLATNIAFLMPSRITFLITSKCYRTHSSASTHTTHHEPDLFPVCVSCMYSVLCSLFSNKYQI